MVDHLAALANESQRFADAATAADLSKAIPSCPGWTMADLVWHLAEVHHFWASIVEGPLMQPELVPDLTRPEPSLLRGLANEQSARLHRALSGQPAEASCWTWFEPDQTIGWVRRRQAHEALIHRIDAELCVGRLTPVDPALAADGIDEILDVQIDGFPAWSTFTPDGSSAIITETDHGDTWGLMFGRLTGTSPNTRAHYDLDHVQVVDANELDPQMRLSGRAADLDLWIWGRATTGALEIKGDAGLASRLRSIAAESTN